MVLVPASEGRGSRFITSISVVTGNDSNQKGLTKRLVEKMMAIQTQMRAIVDNALRPYHRLLYLDLCRKHFPGWIRRCIHHKRALHCRQHLNLCPSALDHAHVGCPGYLHGDLRRLDVVLEPPCERLEQTVLALYIAISFLLHRRLRHRPAP